MQLSSYGLKITPIFKQRSIILLFEVNPFTVFHNSITDSPHFYSFINFRGVHLLNGFSIPGKVLPKLLTHRNLN